MAASSRIGLTRVSVGTAGDRRLWRLGQTVLQAWLLIGLGVLVGCDSEPTVRKYSIPTNVPEVLLPAKQRMLAVMVPLDDQVWFYKVQGPQGAIESVESTLESFVVSMKYEDGRPDLSTLPTGWKRGAERAMRFATVDINTEQKQLDLSISKLSMADDWDDFVALNVNRWRNQVGLPESEEKWAGGEAIDIDAVDQPGVWVDLLGEMDASSSSMSPPFAGTMSGDSTPDPHAGLPPETRRQIAAGQSAKSGSSSSSGTTSSPPSSSPSNESNALQYDRPETWRDGRMSMMRLAAFEAGEEDQKAEITVIQAGGDVRSNVKRWLGQALGSQPDESQVDEAMEAAEELSFGERQGQRFLLTGEEDSGQAIDAVIVPMENGISMFIKMTGPKSTVMAQREAMGSFLDSLTF